MPPSPSTFPTMWDNMTLLALLLSFPFSKILKQNTGAHFIVVHDIVGYIPRELSRVFWFFLSHGGTLNEKLAHKRGGALHPNRK